MSSFNVEEHVIYKIMNAPLWSYPYPHMLVENVFPEDYYQQILKHLPPMESYSRLDETGTVPTGAYKERFITDISAMKERKPPPAIMQFWEDMAQWMTQPRFMNVLFTKFSEHCQKRFSGKGDLRFTNDFRLVRDFTNHKIGPHTDTPRKVFSLLYYLPKDATLSHIGTSVYVSDDPDFTCQGGPHYGFEGFSKVYTAPFIPNTLFLFFKTPKTFHGVDPIEDANIERNVLLYNIYVNPVPENVP